jgi:hypothetical protein
MNRIFVITVALIFSAAAASAQEGSQDLAKDLANPLAALISVPIQGNYNGGIGPDADGEQYYVNVQPVIPISLTDDWNLISRTIVPIISQDDIFPDAGSQFGLGNTTQSLFFSPSKTVNGITWGVGPVAYIPTNTDDLLGPDQWGFGPTAVALWQGSGWTVGMLGNHLWSVGPNNGNPDINSTFVQPFISYTTADSWTFTLNTESTYNWEAEEWSVPVNVVVSKLTQLGKQPVQFFAGVRYWLDSPEDVGPTGLGARAGFTLLFPKR